MNELAISRGIVKSDRITGGTSCATAIAIGRRCVTMNEFEGRSIDKAEKSLRMLSPNVRRLVFPPSAARLRYLRDDLTLGESGNEWSSKMLDESEPITLEYARELEVWTCAWYDEAVAANLVRPPYHPDATLIKRLLGYFHAGLSPAEAAYACFGRRH